MTDPTVRCVIGARDHPADIGYLCTGHYEALRGILREIEDQAAILSAVPSMQQRGGGGGGSRSPASTRTPARLDVIALRDPRTRPAGARPPGPVCHECWHDSCIDIRAWLDAYDARAVDSLSVLDVLHSWARVVREDRDLSAPDVVTVSGERDLLDRHLPWIAAQAWVDEAYGELGDLAAQLTRVNHAQDDRPAGRCYTIRLDGTECGGAIWRRDEHRTVWRVHGDRCAREVVQASDGPAYCDRCGREWDGEELDRLNLILEQQRAEAARPYTVDGRPMRTAAELAAEHGCSVNAVRLRLSKARIKAVHGSYYDPAALDTPADQAS